MGIRYIHLRKAIVNWLGMPVASEPKGGRTIAYLFDKETGVIQYAYSKCRADEHYVKQLGRQVASERLAEDTPESTHLLNANGRHPVEAIIDHFQGLPDANN